jgi:hypothetical protein
MTVDADLVSIPLPDVPDKDIVSAYVKLVGELLYISINTVPEIMYALSALTRFMTRSTSQHYVYTKQVLRYLKGVKHLKLTGVRKPSNPRFSVVNSLTSPMPAGPTTSLRAAARCFMFCASTAQRYHGNQHSLLSSVSLQVSLSSSVWLPALKK